MNPRIIEKTTIINDPLSASQSAKPYIIRIPHIQTKSPLNPESGRVVIVKTTPNSTTNQSTTLSSTPQQPTKSFSVVKLADGQIVLVPTNNQPQQYVFNNENGISRIIKAPSTSPPNPTGIISTIKRVTKEQNTPRVSTIQITSLTSPPINLKSSQSQQQHQQILTTSPQERRLRPIAPAPTSLSSPTANDLINSLLAQQQEQQLNAASAETLLRFDPTASVLLAGEDDSLPIISETVTLDSNGSSLKINNKRKIDSSLPIQHQTSLPVVSSPSIQQQQQQLQQKPKAIRKTPTTIDEKSTTKARLENKATSIIKDSRKKMTPRQVSIPQASTSEVKIQKTPIKRPATTALPPKIDPEEGIRMKICETILRSLIGRIEREQNQESIKTRLEKHSTTIPKSEHRQIILTRLLNERVDILRQDFIRTRSDRKTALVKEQFQIQRLKQQQQIILKQQQQAINIKQEQSISEDETNKDSSPPAKKAKKNNGNEIKHKRQGTPKSSELTIKSTISKRTRPMSSMKSSEDDQSPLLKKVRRSRTNLNDHHDISDNDENLLTNRKSSLNSSKIKPKLITTFHNSIQRKGNKLSSDFKPENLDCSCKRNNDVQDKFYIQCELCSRWLHGKCVGLTARLAEKMNDFICEDCAILTQRAKERLYCICQTPYDESKFYIGCDVCADWLHGSCVNITPEDAEKFEVYVCPRCSTEKKQEFLNKPIIGETRKKLLNLIDQLLAHKMSWPFQKPVDVKDVPNYYKIIKDPMDLTTLKTKVLSNKFKTICDFIRDVNKIFNNCRQFNAIDSTFSQCANVVDNYFRQLLENLMVKEQN
ncbi:unnamed protein product [Adineta steineri]|uniref:Uncharacterized protein n=1 Tax=Adineta steineri TaxID=433720 RepID=A0A818I021_9BILA|nr:unnamed protein product [Adineta steineri]CAF0827040.1 unnamed protein product [Adineta steineri]CAF3517637.1 unnamed protein product [Adineta steineri]CAF3545211.1 unnamed protein product [Adineta steineri]CAF3558851.1 unnamed protein product [Adineta steineri]